MGKVKNKGQTSTVADVGVECSRIQTRSQSRANSTLSADISRDVEARKRNTPSKKQEPETKMTPKEKYPQIMNKNAKGLRTAEGKAKEQLKTPSGTSLFTENCLERPSFKDYLKNEGVSLPQEKKERIRVMRKHRARWRRACRTPEQIEVEKQRFREEARKRRAIQRQEKPEEYAAKMKIQNEQKKLRRAELKQSNFEKYEEILEKRREKRRQTFMETRREQNRLKRAKLMANPEKHQQQLKRARENYKKNKDWLTWKKISTSSKYREEQNRLARQKYFQKVKNMTEEEKRLRSHSVRFRRIVFLSKLSPEQIEARRERKNRLIRLNYQRMSPERKERRLQQFRANAAKIRAKNRNNPEWQLRRRLNNQFSTAKRTLQEKLVKGGASYEEIIAATSELKEKINSQRGIASHTLNHPTPRSQKRSCKEKETLAQRDYQTEKSTPQTQNSSLRTECIFERDESTQVLESTNTPDLSQGFNLYLAYSDVEPSPKYYLLDNTGLLHPVQFVEYVVEDDDDVEILPSFPPPISPVLDEIVIDSETSANQKTISISKRCSLCPAYFSEESQLQSHFSSVHSTAKTHWECTKCKEVLISYKKLVEHSKMSLKCNPFNSGQRAPIDPPATLKDETILIKLDSPKRRLKESRETASEQRMTLKRERNRLRMQTYLQNLKVKNPSKWEEYQRRCKVYQKERRESMKQEPLEIQEERRNIRSIKRFMKRANRTEDERRKDLIKYYEYKARLNHHQREKQLRLANIGNAKRRLKLKLEKTGATSEVIQEELTKLEEKMNNRPTSGQVPEYKPRRTTAKQLLGIEEEGLTTHGLINRLRIRTEEEKAEAKRRENLYRRKKVAAETPEERRKRLWLSRIKNAKLKLKKKLEKNGVPPEMIKIELDKLTEKMKNEPPPSLDSLPEYKPKPRKPKT